MGRITRYPHELIGEKVKIAKATNKSLEGVSGEIVDETRQLILVQTENKVVKVLKTVIIELELLGSGQVLSGEEISKRPEERIKGK